VYTVKGFKLCFPLKNENTYPKGRALMQMYRVVSQTKRGKCRVVYM